MALIDNIPILRDLSVDDLEEKLDLFRKYQHYLYIVINLLVAIQLYFSVISPKLTEYEKEKDKLEKFSKLFQSKKKKATDKKTIESEIASLSDTLEDKQQDFFTLEEVNVFSFTEINKICKLFDLQLNSVEFRRTKGRQQNISSHPLDIKFTGDFYNLMDFIYELENYEKIITVDNIDLNIQSVSPVILRVSMIINLHSIKQT